MNAKLAVLVLLVPAAGCPGARPPALPSGTAPVATAAPFPEGERRAPAPLENPWASLPVGAWFETETVTRVESPARAEASTTTRWTLLARTGAGTRVRIEARVGDVPAPPEETTWPLAAPSPDPGEGPLEELASEAVETPAGRFECRRFRAGTVETWIGPGVPVPVRRVARASGATSTTVLVARGT